MNNKRCIFLVFFCQYNYTGVYQESRMVRNWPNTFVTFLDNHILVNITVKAFTQNGGNLVNVTEELKQLVQYFLLNIQCEVSIV